MDVADHVHAQESADATPLPARHGQRRLIWLAPDGHGLPRREAVTPAHVLAYAHGYQAQRDAVRTALAALPDDDRIRSFDAYRARLLALPESIAVASPARQEELCRILVERVIVREREVAAIDWTPPARPFFEKRQRVCPQGDSNP